MKIKNIAAICKKNKYAVIYERYGESGGVIQYIGDGAAAYPVTGLPALDKESLLTIFDVPEKQREDWFVQVAGIPSEISFEDMDANEKPVEREAISIAYSGKTLKPLQTRRGLVFIESRYLSPVSDILDVLELYERITPGGTPYIVAKAGFLIPARTDTTYFHDYIYGKAEIRFVRGRLRFTDDEGNAGDPAPFPSMVVIYNGERVKNE